MEDGSQPAFPSNDSALAHAVLAKAVAELNILVSDFPVRSTDNYNERRGWTSELAQSAVSRLKDAIHSLDRVVSAVEAESITRNVDNLRLTNSLRPAVALPHEVLEHVFTMTCYRDFSVSEELFGDMLQRPVSLRSVRTALASTCHRWRQIVLRCSAFWTPFFVSNRRFKNGHSRPQLSLLSSIIQTEVPRAHPRPLALFCDFWIDFPKWIEASPILIPLLPSCQLFSIGISVPSTVSWLKGLSGLVLPQLRSLTLQVAEGGGDESEADPSPVSMSLPYAPNLEYLHLEFSSAWGLDHRFTLAPHLPNLRHLVLGGDFSTQNVFDFLAAAPRLVSFSWSSTPFSDDTIHRASLPLLRELKMEGNQALAAASAIEAPLLSQLHLTTYISGPHDLQCLVSCVDQVPFTGIERLTITVHKEERWDLLPTFDLTLPARFSALTSLMLSCEITDIAIFLGRLSITHPAINEIWYESHDETVVRDACVASLNPFLTAREALLESDPTMPHVILNLNLGPLEPLNSWKDELIRAGGKATTVRFCDDFPDPWGLRLPDNYNPLAPCSTV